MYIFVRCLGRTQEAAERVEDRAGQPEDDRLAVQVDGRAHRKINYLKKKIKICFFPTKPNMSLTSKISQPIKKPKT